MLITTRGCSNVIMTATTAAGKMADIPHRTTVATVPLIIAEVDLPARMGNMDGAGNRFLQ